MKFLLRPLVNQDLEGLDTIKHAVVEGSEVPGGFFCKELFEDDRKDWARLPLNCVVYNPSTFCLMAEELGIPEKTVVDMILDDVLKFESFCRDQPDPVWFGHYQLNSWPITPRAMRSENATIKSKNDRTNSYLQMIRCNHWIEGSVKYDPRTDILATMETSDKLNDWKKQRQMMQRLAYQDTWAKLENHRAPASVIHRLSKKAGLLRGSMAGKRVDFSGRSAIVPDPLLPIDQAGIPGKMVMELLRPFLIHELSEGRRNRRGHAKYEIKIQSELAKQAAERIVGQHLIIINRAPSLHRYSLQLSRIRIDWGSKVLRLNPLIFSPMGADSDGDTVAIHLILSDIARKNALDMMHPRQNMTSSADGNPIFLPSHEAIVGLYYESIREDGFRYRETMREISRVIGMPVAPYLPLDKKNVHKLCNDIILLREASEDSREGALRTLNQLNRMGYEFATKAGVSLCVGDFGSLGAATYEEWEANVPHDHSMELLRASGARVTAVQIQSMSLNRGEVITPKGDVWVDGNLTKGMPIDGYIQTARAGRMALASNSMLVPDSGYLYRQILTCIHDITVTMPARGTDDEGLIVDGYGPIAQDDLPVDLSTGKLHPVGARVGLIAAMTICERLTQAALSQKHASGSKQHGSIAMMDEHLSPLVRFKRLLSDVNAWRLVCETDSDGNLILNDEGKVIPVITKVDKQKQRTYFGLLESYEKFREMALNIVYIDEVHLMVLFRGFTEVLEDGKLRSEVDANPDDIPIICGLTMLPLKFGRLLKSLRYGYTSQTMRESILRGETRKFLDSEKIMIGLLPDCIQKKRGF